MFGFGADSTVGLSIGSSSIKLVELKKTGKSWKLLHFGMIQLPDEAIVNRDIVNHIAVSESLKTLVGQLRPSNKNICASLSGTAVIIKRMTLEVPNKSELQDSVFWEAEQYLPFDVSEVVMDYHVVSRDSAGKTDVVLVAIKKASMESYVQVIESAGLKVKILDVDYFALQNVYEYNNPGNLGQAAALVDCGASSLKIVIVQNGVPLFTKDALLGGRNLTLDIQRHLNLAFQDAETLKISGEKQGLPQEVSDLMSVFSENFASEIKRTLDFYNASSTGGLVTKVLLTGGSARIPDFAKTVSEITGLQVDFLNPFQQMTFDASVFTPDYLNSISFVAGVPVGLAIRMGNK